MEDPYEPGTIRSELVKAVYRTWVLNELLENDVAEPVGRNPGSGVGGNSTGSRPPWNSQAAELILDLRIKSRQCEWDFTFQVLGHGTVRGDSDRNTWLALYRVTDLMGAVTDRVVLSALTVFRAWIGRAEVLLGQAEPIRRLPREFGEKEQCCPWCSYRTLRCRSDTGTVFCVNPACRDSDGERPKAVIGVSDGGELTLLWQDGTHRIPTPYQEEVS